RASPDHLKKERCVHQRGGFRQRNCVSRRKEVQPTSLRRSPVAGPHIRPRAATNRPRTGMGLRRPASQPERSRRQDFPAPPIDPIAPTSCHLPPKEISLLENVHKASWPHSKKRRVVFAPLIVRYQAQESRRSLVR